MYLEAIETLIELERGCDTSQLTYGGVSYWPLCRQKIWAQLIQRLVLSRKSGEAPAVPNAGPTFVGSAPVQPFAVGPPQIGLQHVNQAAASRALATGALAPEALFVVRPEEYFDAVDGGRFAKTVDSVIERASTRYRIAKLELYNPATAAMPRTIPSLFLDLQRAGSGASFDPPYQLEHFDALAAPLARAGLSLVPDALRTDMGNIFFFARIFEKVLAALHPSALFQSVYYHPVGMACVLAARRLGILSVDLQHGRLGPHHGLYTDLTAAPASGYDLVPDLVWCWGHQTKSDIERAKNPVCRRHGGLVGGNTWLARWRYGTEPTDPDALAKLEACLRGQKAILVSLQPLDAPLRPEIIAAMRDAPADWLWLLRLHPLRKHTAPAIRGVLAAAGITAFEIDLATEIPLFSLLRRVKHHLTVFSSVVVEAAAFDLHTSVTGEEGRQVFASQIARGFCRYTPTATEILTHAEERLSTPPAPIDDDFVEMRPDAADTALASILGPPQPSG